MIARNIRISVWLLLIAIAMVSPVHAAEAARRVALVIGNSAYAKVARLPNPARDAAAIAATFRRMGFDEVILKTDQNQVGLRRALGRFSRIAAGADVAVLYYAGHGIEVAGRNYLIPTDATLADANDVGFEAVSLTTAMSALERAGKLKLVILDACRNNPFAVKMTRTGATRSVGRGLARVSPAGSDTLVAYAAREGTTADDGSGGHSPYTTALLKVLEAPGLDVRLLFGKVRDQVRAATGNRQEPFTYGSLGGDRIFLSAPAATASTSPGAPASAPASVPASPAASGLSADELVELGIRSYQQKQFGKARARYRSAASQGSVHAMAYLAEMYTKGEGGSKNHVKAARLFRSAANAGHAGAMFGLGKMYALGLGVSRDSAQAARWYQLAANKGNGQAMLRLASLYSQGSGVAKNTARAVDLVFSALQKSNYAAFEEMTTRSGNWTIQFRIALQARMKQRGFYKGPLDGKYGPATKRALEQLSGAP